MELAQSVHACTQVQWSISKLLDKVNHPDLAAEMHVLQDVDRLQQTLADLACLLERLATLSPATDLPREALASALRLASLQARVFGECPVQDGEVDLAECSQTDVTWL